MSLHAHKCSKRDTPSFKPSLIASTDSRSSPRSAKCPAEEPRQSVMGSNMFIGVDETYTSLFPPREIVQGLGVMVLKYSLYSIQQVVESQGSPIGCLLIVLKS